MNWYNGTLSIGVTQKVMTSFYTYHYQSQPYATLQQILDLVMRGSFVMPQPRYAESL
jgi:hypothetical protein